MWRSMLPIDLVAVDKIAEIIWGTEFFESSEVFEEKLNFFPEGCFVYDDGMVRGYVFSHPWIRMNPPKLNSFLGTIDYPDVYHIHDISFLPEIRGKGLVNQIMPVLEKLAQAYDGISLVGVNNTEFLWEKYGFVSIPRIDVTQYCNNAVYMIRN